MVVPGVLGVSASARAWGNCETAVKLALVAACHRGAATDFLRLPDLSIGQCRGCFACLAGGGGCVLADDLAGLLARIREADGLVIASPVYFGMPPSSLMALLGRLLATMGGDGAGASAPRAAVTVTLMGNAKWRGLAEPILNLTASLLGFEVAASLSVVAEGPGEVLSDADAVRRLGEAGARLGAGAAPPTARSVVTPSVASRTGSIGHVPAACPRCGCDAFRIESSARMEPRALECPICGQKGDLDAYLRTGAFQAMPCEARWGRSWLAGHVASWIMPSIARYRTRRKEVLRELAGVKRTYSSITGEAGEAGDASRKGPCGPGEE